MQHSSWANMFPMDSSTDRGWTAEAERLLSPWSMANRTDFSPWAVVLDGITVILVAIAVGWLFQRWRSRRRVSLFRIRLRTPLIGIALLSVIFSRVVAWQREWRNEQDEITAMSTASIPTVNSITFTFAWKPPGFLPEWLLKLGSVGKYFDRVTGLEFTGGTPANPDGKIITLEEALRRATNLRFLSSVAITDNYLDSSAVECLRALRQLRSLDVQLHDGTEINRFNDFSDLEQLTLSSNSVAAVHLSQLPRLRALTIKFPLAVGQNRRASLQLDSLPALESLRAVGANRIHLGELPCRLPRRLDLTDATIDEATLRRIRESPRLESLSIDYATRAFPSDVPFDLHGMAELQSVDIQYAEIPQIVLKDLPNLESVGLINNSGLRRIEFGHLPKLRSVVIEGSPLLAVADVRGLTLDSLAVFDVVPSDSPDAVRSGRPHCRLFPGLAHASALAKLNVAQTDLNAIQLEDIAGLSNLKSLDLSGTWLSDADLPRLKRLTNLGALNLNDTNLTDAAVDVLQDMPSLASVELCGTSITDAGVRRLKQLRPKLTVTFDAGGRQLGADDLRGQIGEATIGQRTAIDVANPRNMGDDDLRGLARLDVLRSLSLSGTHLTDAGLSSIALMRKLQSLDLTGTLVTDAGLAQIGRLGELRELNLSNTRVRGDELKRLAPLNQLISLDLSESDVSDTSLANLSMVPHLKRLSLSHTAVSDAGLVHLSQLPGLRVLNLNHTNVTDAGLSNFDGLSQLEALDLSECDIEGSGLDHLRSLPRLQSLNLVQNKRFGGAGISHLAGIGQLKTLVLDRSDLLSAASLQSLAGMKNLHDIYWIIGDVTAERTAALKAALKQVNLLAKVAFTSRDSSEPAVFSSCRMSFPQVDVDFGMCAFGSHRLNFQSLFEPVKPNTPAADSFRPHRYSRAAPVRPRRLPAAFFDTRAEEERNRLFRSPQRLARAFHFSPPLLAAYGLGDLLTPRVATALDFRLNELHPP